MNTKTKHTMRYKSTSKKPNKLKTYKKISILNTEDTNDKQKRSKNLTKGELLVRKTKRNSRIIYNSKNAKKHTTRKYTLSQILNIRNIMTKYNLTYRQKTRFCKALKQHTVKIKQSKNPIEKQLKETLENTRCIGGVIRGGPTNNTEIRIEDQQVYFERQELQYCTVHAINNCFGERILTGPQLIRYAKDLQRNGADMRGQYNDNSGNFVYYLSSLWLYRHSSPNIYLKPIKHIEQGTANSSTANCIPQHIHTCYLSWSRNDQMPYGHAVSLKRINGT